MIQKSQTDWLWNAVDRPGSGIPGMSRLPRLEDSPWNLYEDPLLDTLSTDFYNHLMFGGGLIAEA